MNEAPQFSPKVPPPMLQLTKPESIERYMLEQLSVQTQQNAWMMERLAEGDARFTKAEADRQTIKNEVAEVSSRVNTFEVMKEKLSGARLAVLFFAVIFGNVGLAFLSAWFLHLMDKK